MLTTSNDLKPSAVLTDAVPGSVRHTVQLAAKRFKTTWVELGRLLVQVRDQALYHQWGYDNFDTYCLKEIRIRKQTAMKLTRSFHFLKEHEPAIAQPRNEATVHTEEHEAPPFEVIEVLAQAEDRGQLSAQEYRSIRDSIWNGEKSVPEVRRELTQRFPVAEEPKGAQGALTCAKLAAMAQKLAQEIRAQKKVPAAVAERAEALADELSELAAAKAEA